MENIPSFLPIIERAVHTYHVPILISTKFLGGNPIKDTNDEPAVEARMAGAIPTGDMTDVMSEVKLMWLLAQGVRDKTMLEERLLVGKMICPPKSGVAENTRSCIF